jgi:hypothetical protein
MDYGKLLSRALNIIWEHKFLILLGVLVALGGGGGYNPSFSGGDFDGQTTNGGDFEVRPGEWPNLDQLPNWFGIAGALLVILIGVAVVIGLALWLVSTIARGGLIAGVDTIEAGGASSFSQAWSAGWHKGWRLIGIGIIPAIPVLFLVVTALGLIGSLALLGTGGAGRIEAGVGVTVAAVACVAIPISIALSLLRTLANRACMLEDQGVFGSYRRGWTVLRQNFGPALILFLIQVGIGIGLAITLLIPGLIMLLCCILLPVWLLIQGAITAYFSTLWTLAWREWTGLSPQVVVS